MLFVVASNIINYAEYDKRESLKYFKLKIRPGFARMFVYIIEEYIFQRGIISNDIIIYIFIGFRDACE